jgi:EmrB/QacA subfamily drug resistance transporter
VPRHAVQKGWILFLCCLAQLMVILDVSVVNVALPSIRNDLGFSAIDLQWIVNAYTLTFAGFLLLGGRAADLLGNRRVFIFGLALFSVASLAGALATNQMTLILARGAQGLGGAVVAPATLSIIARTFTEGAERNRALGLWGATGAAGGALGVVLGGILTDLFGWQAILLINVPIGIAVGLAAYRFIPADQVGAAADRNYDAVGAVAITASMVLLTFGIVRTDVNGWGSAATLLVLGGGLAVLALALLYEARVAARPLIPLGIFRVGTVRAANIVVFFLGCSVFAMWYFVSLYMQQVLGYTPIEAGLGFLPMTVILGSGSALAGRLSERIGAGRVLTFGMLLIGTGLLLFSGVQSNGSYAGDVLLPGLLAAGGIGISFVTVTISGVAGVPGSEAGLASGLINTSRQFGASLGLAVLATVASGRTGHATGGAALTAGFRSAFAVGAGFAFAGAVVAAVGLGARVRSTPALEAPPA